ncbi:ArsC family transcriptional regulator, partial [Campylobacter sp. LR291e]
MKVYGIKNCSSVKKALSYLEDKGINFDFLDIKKINESILNTWLKQRTFEDLINLKGMTARKLNLKSLDMDEKSLKQLVLSNLSLIKRPIIEYKDKILIGQEYLTKY